MKTGSLITKIVVYGATIFTLGFLLFIIAYILIRGIPHLTPSLFSPTYSVDNVSMLPAIVTTLFMVLGGILIAGPIGVFSAFYLVEYAKRGNKLVEIIRITTETLAGIPSIVYGLFGMLFFVIFLGWQYSMISGIFTVAIMVLPTIIRSTEEALMAVDDRLREASFGLGAGKLRTIFIVVLPVAMPGILSGIILAIGRIVGETAALLYTLGSSTGMPSSLFSSGRTLALHMYILSSEALHTDQAYATGVVLLVVVLLINAVSNRLAGQLTKGTK